MVKGESAGPWAWTNWTLSLDLMQPWQGKLTSYVSEMRRAEKSMCLCAGVTLHSRPTRSIAYYGVGVKPKIAIVQTVARHPVTSYDNHSWPPYPLRCPLLRLEFDVDVRGFYDYVVLLV